MSSTAPGIRTVTAREWRNRKIHEGWTLHQAYGSKKWYRYYLVLQKSHLLLFSSEEVSQETMVGTLSIGPKTELRDLDLGGDSRGLCIELRTEAGSGDQKVNVFKFDKPNVCDLWKAFIMGLSNGVVPESVNLLPGQRNNVMETVREVKPRPPPRQALNNIHAPQSSGINNNNGTSKVNHDYDEPANVTSHRSLSPEVTSPSPASQTHGRTNLFGAMPDRNDSTASSGAPESFTKLFSPPTDSNFVQSPGSVFTTQLSSYGLQYGVQPNMSNVTVASSSGSYVQNSGLPGRHSGITHDPPRTQPPAAVSYQDSQAYPWVRDTDPALTNPLPVSSSTVAGVTTIRSPPLEPASYRAQSGVSSQSVAASHLGSEYTPSQQLSSPLPETQTLTKTNVMHWLEDQQEETTGAERTAEVSKYSKNQLRTARSSDEVPGRGLSHMDVQRIGTSIKDEEGTVSSLRQLMHRQNDLAYRALEKETVPRPTKTKDSDINFGRSGGQPLVISKSMTSDTSRPSESSRSDFSDVRRAGQITDQSSPIGSQRDIKKLPSLRSSDTQRSNSPIIQNRVNQLLAATAHLSQPPRVSSFDEADGYRADSPQNSSGGQRRFVSQLSVEQPVAIPRSLSQNNVQRQPEVGSMAENNQRIRPASTQVIHPFYLDAKRNENPPPWFMDCTRDKAETILSLARSSGNVLLRPSSTFIIDGKYVISFRTDILGGSQVHHYSVIRTPAGFLIDVENEHGPMACLSQVLNFFVSVVPHSKLLGPVNLGEAFGQIFSGASPSSDGSESVSHHPPAATVRSSRFSTGPPEDDQTTGDWFHPVVDSMSACSFVADSSDTGQVASEHGYPIY